MLINRLAILLSIFLSLSNVAPRNVGASSIYYVSYSDGSDLNNGLSILTPLKSVARINNLNLVPGDRVLLKCGDTWQGDPLILSKSGTNTAPIQFGSYPASDCANQPALSGSRAVSGWVLASPNVYVAVLSPVDFPSGINQLFRAGQRLVLGRWPNVDAPNGGYSFIDGHTTAGNLVTDNELPSGDWNGAILHIKNIRWSMLDRQVTATNGHTLTLNQGLSCLVSGWGSCVGWGFFINNSLNTLDQDGEWFYDAASRQVYLYSSSGLPANVEGSVIPQNVTDLTLGGLMLSAGGPTAYVVVENLEIKNWFNHGIGTPGGMNGDIYHDITLRNLSIRDVDGAGANISSWLERPSDAIKGLRGGYNLVFDHDTIDGANSFGITGFFANSTFTNNTIRNIALVKNLGKSGMACGLTSSECTENGDGFRIRQYDPAHSGYGNTLRGNTFDTIGYNGVDVFGPETRLENNFITRSCFTKADCGAVRVYGGNNLASTPVYNIHLVNNLIVDIPGNVDGCPPSRAAFGMGLYIDNYSRNVETRGNTIVNTTVSGILYQRSTGQIIGNTVFNASSGTEFSAQIDLSGSETQVSMSGNRVYGLTPNAWTLYVSSLGNILSSDHNYYFQPYVNQHIAYGPSWTRKTFAQWQTLTGQETNSKTNWFSQTSGETSRGLIIYSKSETGTFDLGTRAYLDLDKNTVLGSVSLPPYSSILLVDNGPAPFLLQWISPALIQVNPPSAVPITVSGVAFTHSSVIRWNGVNLTTTWIDSTRLSAQIPTSMLTAPGSYPITVWDPANNATSPVMAYVIQEVFLKHLPEIFH